MTAKRDLKRRVRERQAKTGESYVTALRHVTASGNPEPVVPVIELVELTDVGAPLGYKCRIWMFPELAARVDAAAALEKLRALLVALERDRALDQLRDLALLGVCPPAVPLDLEQLQEYRRFMARVRAGLGGVSPSGHALAFSVDGRTPAIGAQLVVVHAWSRAFVNVFASRTPGIVLATPAPVTRDPLGRWEMLP